MAANVNIQRLFNDNYECFYEGKRSMGMVEITLPELNPKTNEINGAGIAGSMNFPSSAMLENLELAIKWRTLHKVPITMNEPRSHLLEFRGATRNYDAGTGKFKTEAVKLNVRGVPTNLNLGKLGQASEHEDETKMTLDYLKISIDGEEVLEFDRFNYIYKVNGKDWLADTRAALGL